MTNSFGRYPDVRWRVLADKVDSGREAPTAELSRFKLEEVDDYRNDKEKPPLLVLKGCHDMNILVTGPNDRLDTLVHKLPYCIGWSWDEIIQISLERDFANCVNAFGQNCDEWLTRIMDQDQFKNDRTLHLLDLNRADQVCARCANFVPRV